MTSFDREKIEAMRAAGRIDDETAEIMLKTLPTEGSGASRKRRAVAVAIANGPSAKAEAHSVGGEVRAEAGPGESVYSSNRPFNK